MGPEKEGDEVKTRAERAVAAAAGERWRRSGLEVSFGGVFHERVGDGELDLVGGGGVD